MKKELNVLRYFFLDRKTGLRLREPYISCFRYFFLDKKVTQKIKAAVTVRPTIGSFAKQKELALRAQTTFCFTLTSPCGFPAPSPMPVLTSPQKRYDYLNGWSLKSLMSLRSLKSLKTFLERKEKIYS
jgi:hypothetical protein